LGVLKMAIYIGLGLIALIVLFFVSSYNGFVKLRQRIREAFSTMDVYLKQRYDLIPNLVETVKGYASHEKETFERVVEARNKAVQAQNINEVRESNNMLTEGLRQLFALAEGYPELKANTNFLDLQNQLARVEGEIAQSRKYYNAVVRDFNTRREVFPHVLIASLFNFYKEPYFEIEDASQRENVRVSF
jgi:LemA protein